MKLSVLAVALADRSLDKALEYLAARGVQQVEIGCGGCPGKKAALRARELVNRGVDTIAFASCIKKGMPINFPCPHAEKMMELVKKEVGDRIKILEYTH